jgi:hypothetical protein
MLLSRSEYKRFQSAPGPKVTEKAFGRDRRYPLTSGFRNWNQINSFSIKVEFILNIRN